MPTKSHLLRAMGVAAVAGASLLVVPASSVAAPDFCSVSYPGTTITWTGDASGSHKHDWNDADNWHPTTVPDASQDDSTFQTQYVCIGGGASVDIASGDNYHVAGIDIGQGAQLVIGEKGGLFAGEDNGDDLVPSSVEAGSDLTLDAATFGGNADLDVAGTLDWAGAQDGKHRLPATLTGSGATDVEKSGRLTVDGAKFGAAILADGRGIDNAGGLTISKEGFISMEDGTSLVDEASSQLALSGDGGIYPNQPAAKATIKQLGSVTRTGKTISVIGVPTTFGKGVKPTVKSGGVTFATDVVPTSKLPQNASYGVGGCDATDRKICHDPAATKPTPQVAYAVTSTQAPKKSAVKVALTKAPSKLKGSKPLGQSISVTAPTEKTTHSTSLDFDFDTSVKGVGSGSPSVFRGKHKITYCNVAGLTAVNTSCVHKVTHKGGDLDIVVITIQPNATWTVA